MKLVMWQFIRVQDVQVVEFYFTVAAGAQSSKDLGHQVKDDYAEIGLHLMLYQLDAHRTNIQNIWVANRVADIIYEEFCCNTQ